MFPPTSSSVITLKKFQLKVKIIFSILTGVLFADNKKIRPNPLVDFLLKKDHRRNKYFITSKRRTNLLCKSCKYRLMKIDKSSNFTKNKLGNSENNMNKK